MLRIAMCADKNLHLEETQQHIGCNSVMMALEALLNLSCQIDGVMEKLWLTEGKMNERQFIFGVPKQLE